jgi:beta-glucanase (GH16 family)
MQARRSGFATQNGLWPAFWMLGSAFLTGGPVSPVDRRSVRDGWLPRA